MKKRIKREKEELQCLHAFMGFIDWTSASGRLDGEIPQTKLVSYLYFPFISNKR